MITNKDFKNIGQYFLVDFLLNFIKEKKIVNFNIITKKRNDESRVGGSFGLSLKEFNILIKIINKN